MISEFCSNSTHLKQDTQWTTIARGRASTAAAAAEAIRAPTAAADAELLGLFKQYGLLGEPKASAKEAVTRWMAGEGWGEGGQLSYA